MKVILTKKERKFFKEQGRIGGKKTKKMYGLSHFSKIAKMKSYPQQAPLAR